MATLPEDRYTPAEYLVRERAAPYKSEYINGQVYAMAGASEAHNLITGNIYAELRAQLRGRPCRAYMADMRVKISPIDAYLYPDVAALCGEPRFAGARHDNLLNPQVIVEVLSPSTEVYDRREKFAHYRRLPSLSDYVLIAQDRVGVEHFRKQGDLWVFTALDNPEDVLRLEFIDCAVALRDIYERVEFPG